MAYGLYVLFRFFIEFEQQNLGCHGKVNIVQIISFCLEIYINF